MAANQLTDKKGTVNELADELGQATPTTPVGAADIGATSKQADMAGTPAQLQAQQRRQQEGLQKQRLDLQKRQEVEQQQLAGTTLRQAERYETPTQQMSEQQKMAQQSAQTLQVFGPVQAKVQALIQSKLSEVTGEEEAPGVTVGLGARKDLTEEQQPLVASYLAALQDTTSTDDDDTALVALAESLGLDPLRTPKDTLFEQVDSLIGGAAKATLTAGDTTLATIWGDLDSESKAKLEAALGEDVTGLTLDQLDAQITALEAKEFSEIQRLQNILSDPTASATLKQQARDQLKQMGVVGVTKTEESVDSILEAVEAGNTIAVAGQEMTLEELLGDEGLSSIVQEAVTDSEILKKLTETPGYEELAAWITENKEGLASALEEVEVSTTGFVKIQEEKQAAARSWGEGKEQMAALAATQGDFTAKEFVTKKEWEEQQARNKVNPFLNIEEKDLATWVKTKSAEEINAFFAGFVKDGAPLYAEGKGWTEVLNSAIAGDEAAKATLADFSDYIKNTNTNDVVAKDPTNAKTLENAEIKTAADDGGILTSDKAAEVAKDVQRVDAIDDDVKSQVNDTYELTGGDGFSKGKALIEDMEILATLKGSDRQEVLGQIASQASFESSFDKVVGTNKSKARGQLFGGDIPFEEFRYQFKGMGKEQKDFLLSIFDENNDGIISSTEYNDDDLIKDIKEQLGLNTDMRGMLNKDEATGEYALKDYTTANERLDGKKYTMEPGAYKKAAISVNAQGIDKIKSVLGDTKEFKTQLITNEGWGKGIIDPALSIDEINAQGTEMQKGLRDESWSTTVSVQKDLNEIKGALEELRNSNITFSKPSGFSTRDPKDDFSRTLNALFINIPGIVSDDLVRDNGELNIASVESHKNLLRNVANQLAPLTDFRTGYPAPSKKGTSEDQAVEWLQRKNLAEKAQNAKTMLENMATNMENLQTVLQNHQEKYKPLRTFGVHYNNRLNEEKAKLAKLNIINKDTPLEKVSGAAKALSDGFSWIFKDENPYSDIIL